MTTDAARASDSPAGLAIARQGASAVVTLARPEARNALTIGMRTALAEQLGRLGRDPAIYAVVIRSAVGGMFSAGGDVREITALAKADAAAARSALGRELALCWLLECLSKPTVSLIDGPVMGTGVGISLYGTHRVAGERYRFQMPEVAIGYFPDCGVLHHFARMPHGIGRYLALTGRGIGPADALALGLVTHVVPAARFAEIEAHLAEADPVDPALDTRHGDPGPSPLLAESARIERCFTAEADLAGVHARLEGAAAADREWARAVLADLARASPSALAATDAALARARRLDIRETLRQDFRLAWRLGTSHDFHEGVSARLVEKREPRWQPATLAEVKATDIEALLADLGADELVLPSRAEMQAARV